MTAGMFLYYQVPQFFLKVRAGKRFYVIDRDDSRPHAAPFVELYEFDKRGGKRCFTYDQVFIIIGICGCEWQIIGLFRIFDNTLHTAFNLRRTVKIRRRDCGSGLYRYHYFFIILHLLGDRIILRRVNRRAENGDSVFVLNGIRRIVMGS